jgi:hypothetical protein
MSFAVTGERFTEAESPGFFTSGTDHRGPSTPRKVREANFPLRSG